MGMGTLLITSVRQGFWADDCAIEATLTTGSQGGITFRVQDKDNYYFVGPDVRVNANQGGTWSHLIDSPSNGPVCSWISQAGE